MESRSERSFFQVVQYPTSVLLNIVMFIPMGLIAHCRIKSAGRALLVALVAIVAIECIQYVFALGIADVVDVILNMMGFALGYLSTQLAYDQGVRLSRIGPTAFHCFVRVMPAHSAGSRTLPRRSVAALAMLVGIACFGFILAYTFYENDSYVEWDDSPQATEDRVLSALPLGKGASSDVDQARATLASFAFGNASSSSDWLVVTEGGFLSVRGVVAEVYGWLTEAGDTRYAVTLATEEQVGAVTVAHALPLVITPDSRIVLDGETLDLSDESLLDEAVDSIALCSGDAVFSVQDGWLRLESAKLQSTLDAPTPDASIPYATYTEELEETCEKSERGLSLREGVAAGIEAYVDSYTEMEDEDSYITVRVNDLLGSALIGHSLNVACDLEPETQGDDAGPSLLAVVLDAQGLHLAE